MEMFPLPVVPLESAFSPMHVLLTDVVIELPAAEPKAVFPPPVATAKAPLPTPVLLAAVVLAFRAV